MVRMQNQITGFLKANLSDSDSVDRFVSAWSRVLGPSCNDTNTYLCTEAVLAYCHIHFLERYRRFYQVLERMYVIGHLPMRDGPSRILDIGAGPAPCLYAAQDFYGQLRGFAEFTRELAIRAEGPDLRIAEQSPAMAQFVHHFSEYALRPGPFHATHLDFMALDLAELRQESERHSRAALNADWDDPYAPWPFEPVDYKHELYVLSNFLTTKEFVQVAQDRIRQICYWLNPGQQVLIMGSAHKSYDSIYRLVAELASDALVDPVDDWDYVFECRYNDFSAERVKANYSEVLDHMQNVQPNLDFSLIGNISSDVWDPAVRLHGPQRFKALLLRRSRSLGRRKRRSSAAPGTS